MPYGGAVSVYFSAASIGFHSAVFLFAQQENTMNTFCSDRLLGTSISRLGLALVVASMLSASAEAQTTERYPDIHLTYRDLLLQTPDGRLVLVGRVEETAATHCARYGNLIVPYERRFQPRFCANAVRGEILGALPRQIRAAYDEGRRESHRIGVTRPVAEAHLLENPFEQR